MEKKKKIINSVSLRISASAVFVFSAGVSFATCKTRPSACKARGEEGAGVVCRRRRLSVFVELMDALLPTLSSPSQT